MKRAQQILFIIIYAAFAASFTWPSRQCQFNCAGETAIHILFEVKQHQAAKECNEAETTGYSFVEGRVASNAGIFKKRTVSVSADSFVQTLSPDRFNAKYYYPYWKYGPNYSTQLYIRYCVFRI